MALIFNTCEELLKHNSPGELAHVTDEEKTYVCNERGEWEEVDAGDCQLNMNLYELNKTAVASLPDLKTSQLEIMKSKIAQFRNDLKADYYMLLGKDLNYYTVFDMLRTSNETLEEVVYDCLNYLGSIKSFEYLNQFDSSDTKGSMEFWVVDDEGAHVLYLFDYSEGVIPCV